MANSSLSDKASGSVLLTLPNRRNDSCSLNGPDNWKPTRSLSPSALCSAWLPYKVSEPVRSPVGFLVMMLTTPPEAPEP
ncbi:hypothetical protein D9M72_628030 [compost metagenome]